MLDLRVVGVYHGFNLWLRCKPLYRVKMQLMQPIEVAMLLQTPSNIAVADCNLKPWHGLLCSAHAQKVTIANRKAIVTLL